MIQAKINGIEVEVEEGTTILDAAREVNLNIPTLCYHQDLPPTAACGLCIVKIKGSNKMLRSCCTPIEEGMDIITHDTEIVEVRKTVLELILSSHPNDCLKCGRNNNCEFQTLVSDFAIREEYFDSIVQDIPQDRSTAAIVLDPSKCIKCGSCIEVCQEVQDVWALSFLNRGIETRFAPAGDITLEDSPCVKCGQCSAHCPTGAIFENDNTQEVWNALRDEDKYCVVQIAPAVRVAIGEPFGYEPGTNLTGKLYTLLRRLGFRGIFDTNFGADVTIMEEASEFVRRFTEGIGPLPMLTTCCPSWVNYMEKFAPHMIPNFSSCKSPHQIVGVLSKTYYAEKMGIDPSRIFMVSVMPCTAKKYEVTRTEEMFASGYQDVDAVLTTRELARMIKQAGIDFGSLEEGEPDSILGEYSGAGTIFGATGGVMEAAIRTAYHLVTGEELREIEFKPVRGLEGVKECSLEIDGKTVKIAVAHGLGNVEKVGDRVQEAREKGEKPPYDFIEVMACPGGCIGGGGQPYGIIDAIREKRASGLYSDDESRSTRRSHDNPRIKKLYSEFLGEPLGEKAERLLHTHYTKRDFE